MKSTNYKSIIKEHGPVLLSFLVLTLVLTYPVVTHLTTHAAGDGGDGYVFKWIIWHSGQVLREGGGISNIYYTDQQYYPYGTTLTFEELSLTNTLFLAFPLTLITDNLVLIYNLLFLFNFIAAGYAMYLLIKYLVKDKNIAFLVGFAYAFAPLHMAWGLGHLSTMSFCWTPFFFLFFFKMFEEPNLRNSVIAAIFLFFLALASWYHLLFAFLIAAPYFIYKLITVHLLFNRHFFLRIALFLSLFCAVILPFIAPLILNWISNQENYLKPLESMIIPLNYILPSMLHPFFGEKVIEYCSFLEEVSRVEMTVTPGYLVIFISLLYFIKKRKHLFWLSLTGFFFFLSLNPQAIMAPPRDHLPLLGAMGPVSKLSFGVLFSLFILFAFALSYFLPSSEKLINKKMLFLKGNARIVMVTCIFLVLVVEYLAIPYPTTHKYEYGKLEIEFTQEITRPIRTPHPIFAEDFTVLTFSPHPSYMYPLYLQTFHDKKIIEGYIPLSNPGSKQNLRVLSEIVYERNMNKFQEFLQDNRIGYIILYQRGVYDKQIYKNILFFLDETPVELVFTFPGLEIYVYEVLSEKHTKYGK